MNRLCIDVLAPQMREGDRIRGLLSAVEDEIQWREAFSVDQAKTELSEVGSQLIENSAQLAEKERQYRSLRDELAKWETKAALTFNPANWFSKERRSAASAVAQVERQRSELLAEQTSLERVRDDLKGREVALAKDIERHGRNSSDALARDAEAGRRLLSKAQQRLVELDSACKKVDQELGGLSKEAARLEHEQTTARMQLSRALAIQKQLDTASNKYEKAMAHQASEREFGFGNPSKAAQKLESKIQSLERDLQKLSDRFRKAVAQSLRSIRTLIIDGSNCCFAGEDFLGLKPLIAIVPRLAEQWEVMVVFDASIRRRLSTDDQGIRAELEPLAKVHIMATKQKADEFLLDLAANDDAWVISRDRFADFPEKKVVKAKRLMRQEIFDGTFSVPDLKIQTSY